MKIDTRGYGETARAYAYRVIRENIISLDAGLELADVLQFCFSQFRGRVLIS